MKSGDSSLILAAKKADRGAPPFSFFSEVEESEKRLAEAGEFTGERLYRDRPGVYAAIVRMTAEGLSISATARALGVSRNTVCAVRDREGISIEQDKKELLKDLRKASKLGVEKVLELLPETKSAKDAGIVAAVMIDKLQLLSGEATARVEKVELRPDQVRSFLEALPVIEAELVEVDSIGVPAGTLDQRGSGAAEGSVDSQSVVLLHGNSVDGGDRATCQATMPGGAARDGMGVDRGGGGAGSVAHAPGVMNTETQNFGQRPKVRGAGLGGQSADQPLCKRTRLKKKGSSSKGRTTQKKKGGSKC